MLEPSVMKTLCEMAEDWLSPDAYGAVAIPMPVEGGSGYATVQQFLRFFPKLACM